MNDEIEIHVSRVEGVKCPRCWRITGAGRFNFDGLCDRCQDVILLDFPDHESVPGILAAKAEQRKQFGIY